MTRVSGRESPLALSARTTRVTASPSFNFDRAATIASIERMKQIAAISRRPSSSQHDMRHIGKLPRSRRRRSSGRGGWVSSNIAAVRSPSEGLPMKRAYNVVDADGHILEPLDLWDRYIDPEFRERRPRFVIDDNGKERLSREGK